jgi:hypothetical protein
MKALYNAYSHKLSQRLRKFQFIVAILELYVFLFIHILNLIWREFDVVLLPL